MQLHRDFQQPDAPHGAQLRAAGAEVHVIGNGAPMFIAGFRETTGYTGPIYTDPTLAAYEAASLRRGLSTIFNVGALGRSIGSFRRGFRQGRTQGDALQQGGTLVVMPGGAIVYHHVSEGPGDHARAADVVAALARASGAARAPT